MSERSSGGTDHRRAALLVLAYVAIYIVLGIGGITFTSQPATGYHTAASVSNPSPDGQEYTTRPYDATLSVDVSGDPDMETINVEYRDADSGPMNRVGTDTINNCGSSCSSSMAWNNRDVGTHRWEVRVCDRDQHSSCTSWYGPYTFTVNGPPTLSGASPTGGTSVGTTSPELSVDVSDGDGDSVDVTFTNADSGDTLGTDTVSGSGTATYTWSGRSAGESYSWEASATDGQESASTGPHNFEVNGEPTVNSRAPADGQTVETSDPVLNATVQDIDDEQLTVTFRDASDDSVIDQQQVSDTASEKLVTTTWSGPSEGGGPFSWYVEVSDSQTTTTTSEWSFTIADPPEISCSDCFQPELVGVDDQIQFTPTVTDESEGAAQICLDQSCGLSSRVCSYQYAAEDGCTVTATSGMNFQQDFWIRAQDTHGNMNIVYGGRFTVNKRLVINSTQPVDLSLGETAYRTVSVNNIDSTEQEYRLEAEQTSSTEDGQVVTRIAGGDRTAVEGGVFIDVAANGQRNFLVNFQGAQCFSTCSETVEITLTNTATGDTYTATLEVVIGPDSEDVAAPGLMLPQLLVLLMAAVSVAGLRRRWSR